MTRWVRFWARWFPELLRFQSPETALKGIGRYHRLGITVIYLAVFGSFLCLYFYWLDDHVPQGIRPGLFGLGSVLSGFIAYLLLCQRIRKGLRRDLRVEGVMLCIPCGYDLTGNQSGVCPECGKAVAP